MAENSKIEWTDHTFNPWIGCQKVSPGCDHCYAEAMMDHRYGRVKWGPHGERVRTSKANWQKPIQWDAAAKNKGKRFRVFCASLADVFDNKAPKGAREDLWALIRDTPNLDWLLLTKRPQNIVRMLPTDWASAANYKNVWLGTTCEDQKAYDERWMWLQAIRAVCKFISYEPAIGPLRLTPGLPKPDWLICGGETGHGARYMKPEWAAGIKTDCRNYGVKFFMKQMTRKEPIPAELLLREYPLISEAA
jgi:protein gp37